MNKEDASLQTSMGVCSWMTGSEKKGKQRVSADVNRSTVRNQNRREDV